MNLIFIWILQQGGLLGKTPSHPGYTRSCHINQAGSGAQKSFLSPLLIIGRSFSGNPIARVNNALLRVRQTDARKSLANLENHAILRRNTHFGHEPAACSAYAPPSEKLPWGCTHAQASIWWSIPSHWAPRSLCSVPVNGLRTSLLVWPLHRHLFRKAPLPPPSSLFLEADHHSSPDAPWPLAPQDCPFQYVLCGSLLSPSSTFFYQGLPIL